MTSKGPVVLVVLRGYPGYQCLISQSSGPGLYPEIARLFRLPESMWCWCIPVPRRTWGARANEFLVDKKLPNNFDLVLDPGYTFTNMYGVRRGDG